MNAANHRFRIHVQPRSSRKGFAGLKQNDLKICLNSPPEDGKANAELIKFLADALDCSRQDIHIVSGMTSRQKIVEIEDEEAVSRLKRVRESLQEKPSKGAGS